MATKAELSQYLSLQNELKELDDKILRLQKKLNDSPEFLMGKVKGSNQEFPYEPRSFTVYGYCGAAEEKKKNKIERYIRLLKQRMDKALDELNDINEFINSIQKSTDRRIIEYYFVHGMSQVKIGIKMNMDQANVSRIIKKYCNLTVK